MGAAVAGIVVSVACLAAVIWWAARQPAPDLPTSAAGLGAVGAAVALYAANTALRALRWQRLLVHSGASAGFGESLALTVVGYMGNNVMPARAGDVMRVVLGAPRLGASRRDVVGSLLAERLLDIAVLGVLFVALATTLVGGAGLPGGGVAAILAGGTVVAAAAAGVAIAILRRRGQLERVVAFVRPMVAPVSRLRGRHGGTMLVLTFGIWILEAAVWGAVGLAVDLDPSPLEALYLVALASIFSLIPSGPGYAGTQDAAAVIGVRAIGGTSAVAVSYLLLVRFVLLVPITLAGLVLVTTRYGGVRRALRRGSPSPAAQVS